MRILRLWKEIIWKNSKYPSNQVSQIIQPEAFRLNQEFHMTIARASGNTILARLIQQQLEMVERALSLDPFITDSSQHENILSALKKKRKSIVPGGNENSPPKYSLKNSD